MSSVKMGTVLQHWLRLNKVFNWPPELTSIVMAYTPTWMFTFGVDWDLSSAKDEWYQTMSAKSPTKIRTLKHGYNFSTLICDREGDRMNRNRTCANDI